MFMSKFHGRRLTLADFKEALFQFFHSGRRLRRELLSPVLQRLRDMQAALEGCESYRFYSSSLLIIYDGATHRKHTRQHTEDSHSEEDEEEEEEYEDDEPEAEPEMEEEEEEEVGEVAGALGFPHSPSMSSEGSSSSGGSPGVGQARLSHSEPRGPVVDVRMIDFAHTTCRHFQGDTVVYEGLDSGYLFGLQNLITIISELENHSTDWKPLEEKSRTGLQKGRDIFPLLFKILSCCSWSFIGPIPVSAIGASWCSCRVLPSSEYETDLHVT